MDVLVADEVWIATALLHRRYPEREDFAVSKIIRQAEAESVTGRHSLRPSFQDYAYLHCVANKEPGAVRHRMLLETAKGRRRLFKPRDPCHRRRLSGKDAPHVDDVPAAYRKFIEWYRKEYAGASGETDPILSLRGLGKKIRTDENADAYVERLRGTWG